MTFISFHILLTEFHTLWQLTGIKKNQKEYKNNMYKKESNTESHTN